MGSPRADTEALQTLRARLDHATAELDPPLAVVDLTAFDANADALVARAGGRPVRVASKSVRSRALLIRALARPGFHGVLAFTLPEALWLVAAGVTDDVVVAYPTADRAALRALAADERALAAVAIMVDDLAQLDLVDAAMGAGHPPVRVCLELDVAWRPLEPRGRLGQRVHVGARRSPVRSPEQARGLAQALVRRPGFRLVGVMAYEAQVAGVPDAPRGGPAAAVRGFAVRRMQAASVAELHERRAAMIDAVRAVATAPLELVNGGGTGSLETSAADPTLTELAAGSGLYGPALFDGYSRFRPRPAALFALPVVRRPGPGWVTVLGGGYLASGPGQRDRLPTPYLPAGLRLSATEGAGEVQTPLHGPGADRLRVGDRVWLRHAKAGELAERFALLHLVDGDRVVDAAPTYRGEGQTFL
ncbi:MAG TPA: amino acid deaminase/aldolase [Actinomycetes bacterium]|nr:amino acid deaminase/aldolase [Actinomycetes bacterium]